MPIISSQIISRSEQRGGVLVTEAHTANTGEVFNVEYLAIAGVDTAAILSVRASYYDQVMAEQEAAGLLNGS
jgi:hypothetical protein